MEETETPADPEASFYLTFIFRRAAKGRANAETARLRLTVPQTLIATADDVIE